MVKSFYVLGDLSVELEEKVYKEMFTEEDLLKMEHGEAVEWTDKTGEVHSVRMLIKTVDKKANKTKSTKKKK